MATDPQRSDRGLIAFQTPFSPAFPVQPLINLEYGGIVGFDGARGGTDGPWDTPTGETSLGPAGNTSVLIYSNVEPGPLEISVG
nr:hypothetical protein [Actinomycetota bacterium]NIS33679.1 hypothetical protein [Actinomycetota bacterium]NIV88690.1 hypothetical protein [Actinomycetota bacterium]